VTTNTVSSRMPEPDTSDDAQPPENPKVPFSEKNILNTTNIIVAILCSTLTILFALGGVFVRGVQTEQRSIETAVKLEKVSAAIEDLSVIKVKQAYMEQAAIDYRQENTKKLDSIVGKLDKIADRK
jgi:flagellar basal body-associated protein FliL